MKKLRLVAGVEWGGHNVDQLARNSLRWGVGLGYQIKSIDLLMRELGPPRMDFAIGKGQSLFPEWMRVNVEVRLRMESDNGRSAFGCSADWPSFGWLDKRPDVAPKQKLKELLGLIGGARDAFVANSSFDTPFEGWWKARAEFLETGAAKNAVPLCASFAVALIERAVIDAVCRLEEMSFQAALAENRLGLELDRIHPELSGFVFSEHLPKTPLERIQIRHTIGLSDPLLTADVAAADRLTDGEPYTLEEYVEQDGIRSFKVKICGDLEQDLKRLGQIWNVIGRLSPAVTLDGNEAFSDVGVFGEFVKALSKTEPELFGHIKFIEQPMGRGATHDVETRATIEAIGKLKPLIIDEADGYLHAFSDAAAIGYRGVSHKNCKGVFKSLANFALCGARSKTGKNLFISPEDLTSMPLVALQQDFAVVSALGLDDAERNGHHFFRGLRHLSERERRSAEQHYPGLYKRRDGELFLNIVDGQVDVSSLRCAGMGVVEEPDFGTMSGVEEWSRELG